MEKTNENTKRAFVRLKRLSDEDYNELFSDEFIEKFDYDLNEFAAKWTPAKDDKEELSLDSDLLEMVRSGNTTDLFDDLEGCVHNYFMVDYDVADKLKLYDVFSVKYFFKPKDEKTEETLDYCDEVFVPYEMSFLVIGKEYTTNGVDLILIPVSCDLSNELQIRLTSGKF